jgi:hypothetical protein
MKARSIFLILCYFFAAFAARAEITLDSVVAAAKANPAKAPAVVAAAALENPAMAIQLVAATVAALPDQAVAIVRAVLQAFETAKVEKAGGSTVQVAGMVNRPQAVPLSAQETINVLDAVLRAGGFGGTADRQHVRLTRVSPGGQTETFSVNTDQLGKGAGDAKWIVRPSDAIFVPVSAVEIVRAAILAQPRLASDITSAAVGVLPGQTPEIITAATDVAPPDLRGAIAAPTTGGGAGGGAPTVPPFPAQPIRPDLVSPST